MISAAIPWLVMAAIVGVAAVAFPVVVALAVASALGVATAARRKGDR